MTLRILPEEYLRQKAEQHELSSAQTDVFLLRFNKGFSNQEIADCLGLKTRNVVAKRMSVVYEKFQVNGDTKGKEDNLWKILLDQYTSDAEQGKIYRGNEVEGGRQIALRTLEIVERRRQPIITKSIYRGNPTEEAFSPMPSTGKKLNEISNFLSEYIKERPQKGDMAQKLDAVVEEQCVDELTSAIPAFVEELSEENNLNKLELLQALSDLLSKAIHYKKLPKFEVNP